MIAETYVDGNKRKKREITNNFNNLSQYFLRFVFLHLFAFTRLPHADVFQLTEHANWTSRLRNVIQSNHFFSLSFINISHFFFSITFLRGNRRGSSSTRNRRRSNNNNFPFIDLHFNFDKWDFISITCFSFRWNLTFCLLLSQKLFAWNYSLKEKSTENFKYSDVSLNSKKKMYLLLCRIKNKTQFSFHLFFFYFYFDTIICFIQ